ncbi:hypothetical protein IPA_04915 [Ignicoccus pacificus DSM 13166]|uniref:Uncharacterized protein n=1 Tax=Ignicoccus pacificus DSM 13166 TaxID=940294 RepID=A0A977KB93_9CREN|nr:hypothetical protein IPA_04915 [Ignicoccus pacificus DSM 13166]
MILVIINVVLAQSFPQQIQEFIKRLPYEIIKFRQELINFVLKHQIHFFALGIAIPLGILLYFDAKLFYRLLRDITYIILRRKEMLPIEKKWYAWRIGMKIVGILILSAIAIIMSGWVAWVLNFKTLNDMLAALDKLRREQNPFQIIETMLRALRRR